MSLKLPGPAVIALQPDSTVGRRRGIWRTASGVLSQVLLFLAASSTVLAQTSAEGTASISGTATLDGSPAPAIVVILTHIPTNPEQNIQEMVLGAGRRNKTTTRTDSAGHYRFEGLTAGLYQISTLTATLVETGPNSGTRSINVGDDDSITGWDFQFTKAGAISGRVTTQDGRALIGVKVLALKSPNTSEAAGNPEFANDAKTDDRGQFRVYGMPAGKYIICVMSRMPEPNSTAGPSIPADTFYPGVTERASATQIELASGTEMEGIDIKVGTGLQGFEVSGRVVDDSGRGVPDVAVSYGPGRMTNGYGAMQGAAQYTDSKGGFKLEHVMPGEYSAAVSFPFLMESDIYGEPTKFVVINGNVGGVELKVHTGLTISGVAVLEGTDDPQAAANLTSVQLFAASDSEGAETISISRATLGSDGTFTLKGLPPGKVRIQPGDMLLQSMYRLTGIKQNGVLVDGITLSQGQSATGIELVLGYANCTITGQVTLEGGKLPVGTTLFVNAVVGSQQQSGGDLIIERDGEAGGSGAQVDPSGHFKIEHLVPGDYQVVLMAMVPPAGNGKPPDSPALQVTQSVTLTSGNEGQVAFTIDVSKLSGNN
jgi:hypothetical protein